MKLQYAIGDTLRNLRQERHMTLRNLSIKSNVAIAHISDVERGRKQLSNDLLESVAHGLNLSTVELLGEIYDYLKEHNEV
jgi:transcriptional regulator with XRE-family HTH domain